MSNVINALFLQPADRVALEGQYFCQGCPTAFAHVIEHVDRIVTSDHKQTQQGIVLGLVWAYLRVGLLSVSDMRYFEGEASRLLECSE